MIHNSSQQCSDTFTHHYQGSIDFNIVNIHPTVFLDRISIKKGNHAFAAETGPSCQSRVSPNVWLKQLQIFGNVGSANALAVSNVQIEQLSRSEWC